MTQTYVIWYAATLANLLVLYACWTRRRGLMGLFVAEGIWWIFGLAENLFFFLGLHESWPAFDFGNLLFQLGVFSLLTMSSIRLKNEARLLPFLYFGSCLVAGYERILADDGRRDLANHLYYGRQWTGVLVSLLLAHSVYHCLVVKENVHAR